MMQATMTTGLTHQRRPFEARGRGVFRLWLPLPLILVWLVLAPFLIVLSPLLALCLAMVGLNPFKVLVALCGLMAALAGTRVEIDAPDAVIHIHLF